MDTVVIRDWTDIFAKHLGQWVAIDSADEQTVIAADPDPEKALALSVAQGKSAFLLRVPEKLIGCIKM